MKPGQTLIFERGESIYLVASVAPLELAANELEELAFSEDLKKMAPNEHILWLRGAYAEADNANRNGHVWSAAELEIASVTPVFMPITVMHDPRTAVGLIADTRLRTPDLEAELKRARIDTTLAVWKHRFPEVADEIAHNYREGTLMQSMECRPGWYECIDCGARFPKLPGNAEQANWCDHLREQASAANGKVTRRLGNVTFTGTGLIFGTRGSRGAYDDAHLDVLAEDVAEFHQNAKSDRPKRRTSSVDTIEINRSEYDELKAKAARIPDLEKERDEFKAEADKVADLEKRVEAEETAKTAAEKERDDLKAEKDKLEEQARADTLGKDRLGSLGKGFKAKLGDFTRGRLEEQAGKLSDDEWDSRLKELEEIAGVKRDEGGAQNDDDDTANNDDELASTRLGGQGSNGAGASPSRQAVGSVVKGLIPAKK